MFYLQLLFFCVTLPHDLDYLKNCSRYMTFYIFGCKSVGFNDLLVQKILCVREKKFARNVQNPSQIFHSQVFHRLIEQLWNFYVSSQRTEHLVVNSRIKYLKNVVLLFLMSEPCVWWYIDETYYLTIIVVKYKVNSFNTKDSLVFAGIRKLIVLLLRLIYHLVCLYRLVLSFDLA